jgi:hypothetical protein
MSAATASATAAVAKTAGRVCQSSSRVCARPAFFTGAQVQRKQVSAPVVAARRVMQTRALFGGSTTTADSLYNYTVKVGAARQKLGSHTSSLGRRLLEAGGACSVIVARCALTLPGRAGPAQGIDGKDIKMDRFKGKVLLIINVASACGGWGGVRWLWGAALRTPACALGRYAMLSPLA